MLLGTALQDEGVWREASVQSFAMAVTLFPEDAEALASAGEGSLEYGRRGNVSVMGKIESGSSCLNLILPELDPASKIFSKYILENLKSKLG